MTKRKKKKMMKKYSKHLKNCWSEDIRKQLMQASGIPSSMIAVNKIMTSTEARIYGND